MTDTTPPSDNPCIFCDSRHAVTLVEVLIVLAIVAILFGLLFPAVQATRERARESVCKNNLHQLNTALSHYAESHKQLPKVNPRDRVGGWTIEILPYIEEVPLREKIKPGTAIVDAPDYLWQPPQIFRCPMRTTLDEAPATAMESGHYVLAPLGRRDSFSLYDAPVSVSIPWAAGPEMDMASVTQQLGPHSDGFFYSRGFQQSIDFASSTVSSQ
jgi:prepilin-type N-terminal cleavage/methylation domain-containing protein